MVAITNTPTATRVSTQNKLIAAAANTIKIKIFLYFVKTLWMAYLVWLMYVCVLFRYFDFKLFGFRYILHYFAFFLSFFLIGFVCEITHFVLIHFFVAPMFFLFFRFHTFPSLQYCFFAFYYRELNSFCFVH